MKRGKGAKSENNHTAERPLVNVTGVLRTKGSDKASVDRVLLKVYLPDF